MKQEIVTEYFLYDGRYLTNPDRAICFEVCETLKEAKANKGDYGNNTYIVKTLSLAKGNSFEVISQEIIEL